VAIGLVCTLAIATAVGSNLIARAVATRFANAGSILYNPSLTSPPAAAVPPSAASVASLLAVLGAAPGTPGVTVDPELASSIVDSMWPVREDALDTRDVSTLADFESGSALQGDTAEVAACDCPNPLPRAIATRNLFVPRETTYPSWFVSELTTYPVEGSASDVSLMVFTRASLQTRWMLSLETGYSFARGAGWVYATPESAASGFDLATTDHDELPLDLGAYYQYWADQGTAPPTSPFASGAFTTSLGEAQASEDRTLAGEGEVHRVVYSVDVAEDGDWSVAANNIRENPSYGWVLSCGTVRYEAVTTLAAGAAPMVQPADLSAWGSTLPSGSYTRITQWGLHESCFLDDIAGIPYIVLGRDGGVIRSAGIPAGGSS
jgi:hypothetical protein